MFSSQLVFVVLAAVAAGGESYSSIAATMSGITDVFPVNAQVPNCARNYTVELGDTCNGISAKENVST